MPKNSKGFFADRIVLTFVLFFAVAVLVAPAIVGLVTVTATVNNQGPDVGQLQLCDGTCALTKTVDPATQLTIRAVITDPNGRADINTASFWLEIYTATDLNGAAEDWDHNSLQLNLDQDRLSTGNANGCTESATVFCLTMQSTTWSTKFLQADANIFLRVDDNSNAMDWNSLTTDGLIVNASIGTTEDTTSGTYSGNPNTLNNEFDSGQTVNDYIITTHNGNTTIDVNIVAQHFVITSGAYAGSSIQDKNQTWNRADSAATSTQFTAGVQTTVDDLFARGTYADSNTLNIYFWLDIPDQQPPGSYDSNMTYGTRVST